MHSFTVTIRSEAMKTELYHRLCAIGETTDIKEGLGAFDYDIRFRGKGSAKVYFEHEKPNFRALLAEELQYWADFYEGQESACYTRLVKVFNGQPLKTKREPVLPKMAAVIAPCPSVNIFEDVEEACTKLGKDLLREHAGAAEARRWSFKYDAATRKKYKAGKNTLGFCHCSDKTIYIDLEALGEEAALEVVRHEVAHALSPVSEGHGPIWKRWARTVGADPMACHDRKKAEETLVYIVVDHADRLKAFKRLAELCDLGHISGKGIKRYLTVPKVYLDLLPSFDELKRLLAADYVGTDRKAFSAIYRRAMRKQPLIG